MTEPIGTACIDHDRQVPEIFVQGEHNSVGGLIAPVGELGLLSGVSCRDVEHPVAIESRAEKKLFGDFLVVGFNALVSGSGPEVILIIE